MTTVEFGRLASRVLDFYAALLTGFGNFDHFVIVLDRCDGAEEDHI